MQEVVALVSPDQEIYPTWKMKEVLAHITGWDEAVIEALKAVLDKRLPATPARQGIDAYNAQSVEERRNLGEAQVKQEWQMAREEVRNLLRQIDDAVYVQEII